MLKNNGRRIVESKLKGVRDNETLIDFLVRRFPYHEESVWRQKIIDGELTLDGGTPSAETLPANGQLLLYSPRNLVEPEVDSHYRIVAEDADFLVVDKPGNLPCHPAGPYFEHTLWYLLAQRYGEIHPVNRLDRETSGLCLWARNSTTAAQLARSILEKRYFVLVHGHLEQPFEARGVLFADPDSRVRKKRRFSAAAPDHLKSESAATTFRPVRSSNGYSLLEATLETGRTHQIRATLCSLGFPVVGDKLYGLDETFYLKQRSDELTDADRARLLLPRQALHSARLTFRAPDGTRMEFNSDAPLEFLAPLAPER